MNEPYTEPFPFPGYEADSYRTWLEGVTCTTCGLADATLVSPGRGHWGFLHCPNGHHLKWMPKPVTPKEAKARRRYPKLARLEDDRCAWCGKARYQLPPGEDLVEAHLIDRAALIDEGYGSIADAPENRVWLCTRDHAKQTVDRAAAARDVEWHEILQALATAGAEQ